LHSNNKDRWYRVHTNGKEVQSFWDYSKNGYAAPQWGIWTLGGAPYVTGTTLKWTVQIPGQTSPGPDHAEIRLFTDAERAQNPPNKYLVTCSIGTNSKLICTSTSNSQLNRLVFCDSNDKVFIAKASWNPPGGEQCQTADIRVNSS
jgi:hypothetical protein